MSGGTTFSHDVAERTVTVETQEQISVTKHGCHGQTVKRVMSFLRPTVSEPDYHARLLRGHTEWFRRRAGRVAPPMSPPVRIDVAAATDANR